MADNTTVGEFDGVEVKTTVVVKLAVDVLTGELVAVPVQVGELVLVNVAVGLLVAVKVAVRVLVQVGVEDVV